MRTVSYMALIAAISMGVCPHAKADLSQGATSAAETPELPLISLEKSLIPASLSVVSSQPTDPHRDPSFLGLANALVRGLLVANRTGEIGYQAPLSFKVQSLVRGLRRGEALKRANVYAGVPFPVVSRLLELGNCGSDIN